MIMGVAFILIIFGLITLLLLLSLRTLAVTGVPVVHMDQEVVNTALDMLALGDGESFCDLGCGTGNVLLASRKKADVFAAGMELNPAIAFIAACRTIRDRKIKIRLKDARKAELWSYNAIYVYLMPHTLKRMFPAFDSGEKRDESGGEQDAKASGIKGSTPSMTQCCESGVEEGGKPLLRPGTRLVSINFEIPGWNCREKKVCRSGDVYLYVV